MSHARTHLDALARVLADDGWMSCRRYDQVPALLRVFHAARPRYGDCVRVAGGPNGEPWFVSSTGAFLAPCREPQRAVVRLTELIDSFRPIAEQLGFAEPVPGDVTPS